MKAHLFGKCAGFPAFHPRGRYRNPVNRTGLHRGVTAYYFETFSAKHLAGAGDVSEIRKLMRITVLVNPVVIFDKRRACYSQVRIGAEFLQQELEVIGTEGDIGIEIADEVPSG